MAFDFDPRALPEWLRLLTRAKNVQPPPGDFMRLEVETLLPKTLIDACESKLLQGPNVDQGYLLALYEGESKLWN